MKPIDEGSEWALVLEVFEKFRGSIRHLNGFNGSLGGSFRGFSGFC
jgi:hypothetical protein